MTAPLFYVDNMPYTQPDCDQIVQCLEERPEFQEPAGCPICGLPAGHRPLAGPVPLAETPWRQCVAHSFRHPLCRRPNPGREHGCTYLLFGEQLQKVTPEVIRGKAKTTCAEGGELIQLSSGTTATPKPSHGPGTT